ncbi:hypothetical protein QAD02_007774 [Eretmocerus hayati]|uniref:Uncharacterized protein n=1 Tax=Eretmocerus hayati TaxID=131215 RepID=A0ACC2N4W5_9HYME|nr:hypothetical protein QAD02_007774 [Eretmocerus hayati]
MAQQSYEPLLERIATLAKFHPILYDVSERGHDYAIQEEKAYWDIASTLASERGHPVDPDIVKMQWEKKVKSVELILSKKSNKARAGKSNHADIEPYMQFFIPYWTHDADVTSTSLKRKETKEERFEFSGIKSSYKIPKLDKSALPAARRNQELHHRLADISDEFAETCNKIVANPPLPDSQDPHFPIIFNKLKAMPPDEEEVAFVGMLEAVRRIASRPLEELEQELPVQQPHKN